MSTNKSEDTYDELAERAERGELSVKPGTVRVGAAAKLSHGFLEIEKEEHDETRAERDAALAAIERVRAIHERDMVLRDYCSECSDFGSDLFPPGQMVEWPCLTIRAIEDALGGEGDEYR